MDMFLWMMPMPPSCAMVIARRASVTVSIAAETTGRLTLISRVNRLASETSRGSTSEYAGTSKTSSNVSASSRIRISSRSQVRQEAAHCTLRVLPGKPQYHRPMDTAERGPADRPGRKMSPDRDVYTVSRLNREVRVLLERGFGTLWLEAEISRSEEHTS